MSSVRPPRVAERVLRSLVGGGPDGASIVGDLHEEYVSINRERGHVRADLWYARQLLATGLRYARPDRVTADRLLLDLTLAGRGLRREPGFAAAVIVTLALAIGAGTAIFSVVDGVILRPLPFENPDQLVRVWAKNEKSGDLHVDLLYQDIEAFASGVSSFSSLSGLSVAPRLMLDERGENGEDLIVARTSVDFFATLGIEPEIGRTYTDEEAETDAGLILISHALWERRFGSDRSAIGRMVHLDSRGFEIIGVLPSGSSYPYEADVWKALTPAQIEDDDREAQIIARLVSGTTLVSANAEVAAVGAALAQVHPESHTDLGAWTQAFQSNVVREVSLALYALLGAVSLVLLIACVNTANLLLARGARRSHEVAIRIALGAGRGRIISFHLTESLLLAALGGLSGLMVGRWVLAFMLTVSPELPRLDTVTLDGRVIAVMTVVTAIAGILFGVGPALHAASSPPERALRYASTNATSARGGLRAQSGLVATEVALSTVLAFLALLLFSTFHNALTFDRGFELDNLVSITLDPMHPPEDGDEGRAYFEEIRDRVVRLGGVRAAALTSHDILEPRGFRAPVAIEGRATPVPTPQAYINIVSPDFFETAGITLLEGANFSESGGVTGDAELIVNQRFAATHLSDGAARLGTRVNLDWVAGHVVAVVRDIDLDLAGPALPKVYVSMERFGVPGMALTVRVMSDPATVLPDIEREIEAVASDVLLEDVFVIEQAIEDSVAPERFNMLLVVAFAVLALTLAAIGIYGVTALSVASRRSEIGIRRALGASDHRVASEVARRIATLTAAGIAVGIIGATFGGRLLSGLLVGVTPTDPVMLAGVAIILSTTAAAACAIPVMRAVRIDPREALRSD